MDPITISFNKRTKDLTNKRFGRLVAIKPIFKDKYGKLSWECKCDCGNTKITTISNLTSGGTISCGCYRIELNKSRVGPKGSNWNHNLSIEDRENKSRRIRSITGYNEWRISVYRKNNFTCQKCGTKDGHKDKFNAHHILSYSEYPDLRTDISNGITFCKKCHSLYHKIYGKKNNNLNQIEEFIGNKYDNEHYN